MSFKTIMVHVGSDDQVEARLGAAMSVGRRFGAAIFGVAASTWDAYVDPVLALGAAETVQMLRDEVEAQAASAARRFESLTRGYPHPVIWKAETDYPSMAMRRLAAGADLVVASRPGRTIDHRRFPAPTDLIMGAGVPVLLLPPSGEVASGAKILVGWKNTRETRRAVTDALPLLQKADRVYLVQAAERGTSSAALEAELDDVVARLGRHGVFAEASVTPRVGEAPVDDLMAVATARGCDLAVFGAYGHSRAREWALGGVSAALLDHAPVPILFSR